MRCVCVWLILVCYLGSLSEMAVLGVSWVLVVVVVLVSDGFVI